jgi:hypothetical protein
MADKSRWATLGWWSMLFAFAGAAQVAARGVNSTSLMYALGAWLLLTGLAALVLGIRHLLSRRDRRNVGS